MTEDAVKAIADFRDSLPPPRNFNSTGPEEQALDDIWEIARQRGLEDEFRVECRRRTHGRSRA